jgi:hypothetical protein
VGKLPNRGSTQNARHDQQEMATTQHPHPLSASPINAFSLAHWLSTHRSTRRPKLLFLRRRLHHSGHLLSLPWVPHPTSSIELLGDLFSYELTRGLVLLADMERQPASFDGADLGFGPRGGVGVFEGVEKRRCVWLSLFSRRLSNTVS